MESAQTASKNLPDDVLHGAPHASLTPEEIAKAIAHHKKHHAGDAQKEQPAAKKQNK